MNERLNGGENERLSKKELEEKMQSFMARKLEKYPELKQQPDRKRASYLHVPRRGAFTDTITFPYLALHKAR